MTPLLATEMCNLICGNFIRENFREMQEGVAKGNFDKLPVMHHLLSGLKACISENMVKSIDISRRNCGGAGY